MPACTTQGGGGSFKNRKTIGEVGCCESCKAERAPDESKNGWRQRSGVEVCSAVVVALVVVVVVVFIPVQCSVVVVVSVIVAVLVVVAVAVAVFVVVAVVVAVMDLNDLKL